MLTKSMAQNPAILGLSPISAKTLLIFYRAHISADEQGSAWFAMPRKWVAKLLGVSMSTADRVLAELEAAGLIVQQGKRAWRKPACYRLALTVPVLAERNVGLCDASPLNPLNVVMGDDIAASNVVMGDDTRAHTLNLYHRRGNGSSRKSAAPSPSLATDAYVGGWRPRCGGYACAKAGECLRPGLCAGVSQEPLPATLAASIGSPADKGEA